MWWLLDVKKYDLYLFILGYSVAGIVFFGVGIAILPIVSVPLSMVVMGVMLYIASLLISIGDLKKNELYLLFYMRATPICALLKIWLLLLLLSDLNGIQETVDQWLNSGFNNNRTIFNLIELNFLCCGKNGSSSYIANSEPLPLTCCSRRFRRNYKYSVNVPGKPPCTPQNANPGCGGAVKSWMQNYWIAYSVLLLIVVYMEAASTVTAYYHFRNMKNGKNTKHFIRNY